MEFILSVFKLLVVVTVLSILIIVHEWGHFIAARKLGIGVQKFSIGFGKKLFSRVFRGTEFMISAVPFGGYVKLAGDERDECQGKEDEFYSHPPGHRAAVVLMGPVMNFVFAYVCFYLICATGFPMLAPKVGDVREDSPALQAGIEKDDYVFAIDAQKIESWKDIQEIVRHSRGKSLQFHMRRKDQIITQTLTPEVIGLKNMFGKEEQVPVVGIQPAGNFVLVHWGPLKSLSRAWEELINIPILTFKVLFHIVAGDVPARGNIGGPVTIVVVLWESVKLGFAHVVYITAVINASLAVINLFPFPVLDGGHILFIAIEKVRRRPLPFRLEETLTRIGMGLLLFFMVLVLYNDFLQLDIVGHFRDLIHHFGPPAR